MNINDRGIILAVKKMQESAVLIKCFTREHGVITGYHKIKSTANATHSGSVVLISWRARVQEQLGTYTQIEPVASGVLAEFFIKPKFATIFNAALAIYNQILKERDIYKRLWDALRNFIEYAKTTDSLLRYAKQYVLLELTILEECGFGLNLKRCVVTGIEENLTYISPKSGAAVSAEIGKKYAKKLFVLHQFLITNSDAKHQKEILDTMDIIEFFIKKHLIERMPTARIILYDFLKLSCDSNVLK